MSFHMTRRQLLGMAEASFAALILPRLAFAQKATDPLQNLLEGELGQKLGEFVPDEVFEATRFVRALLALEREAKTLKLPQSPLSRGRGAVATGPDELYEAALPRLVALIDRSEFRNLRFADRAGDLLARLHFTQHEAPEGLGGIRSAGPPSIPVTPDWEVGPATVINVSQIELLPAAGIDAPLSERVRPQGEVTASVKNSRAFADLSGEYVSMFSSARLRTEHVASADWHLTMLRQSRARYVAAGERAGVPWYFIAVIHGLEASFNFRAHFHNGDFPLNRRTKHVPEGRPLVWLPPSDWEASTVDALRLMGFSGMSDWSLPHLLYRLEAFNGFGYRRRGRPSPYLWSFSSHYDRGKFVADGRFNPQARSQQCGAAIVLKLLSDDGEINLT